MPFAELLVPMFGVVGALLLFAGLLHLGRWIVRLLKLPNDLPEGPHFEPPPPPIRDVLDHAEAGRVAAHQARLRALYAKAREAAQASVACAELAAQDYVAVQGAPDPGVAKAGLAQLAARAKAAAEAAEQAVRRDDPVEVDVTTPAGDALAAKAEAEGIAGRFPSGRERRLRWMLILLAVMILWTLAMHFLLPRVR